MNETLSMTSGYRVPWARYLIRGQVRVQLVRLFLEHPDELFPDDLPLLLGVDDSGKPVQKQRFCVDMDQVGLEDPAEDLDDVLGFTGPQQAVIHEDAGQVVPDGLGQKRRGHGRVHPTAQGAEDARIADLFSDRFGGRLDERRHRPIGTAPADVREEVVEDFLTVFRMHYFGMKLHAVHPSRIVFDGGDGGVVRFCDDRETFGRPVGPVPVAHPDVQAAGKPPEQARFIQDLDLRGPEFASVRPFDFSAEQVSDHVHAVADAEHGYAQVQDFFRNNRRILFVNRRGAP